MRKHLSASIEIVNEHIILIVMFAFPMLALPFKLSTAYVINSIIYQLFLSLVILPIIYGKLVEAISGPLVITPYRQIYKKNALNYCVVMLIVYGPYNLVVYFAGSLLNSIPALAAIVNATVLKIGLKYIVHILMLYVMPLVFIKNIGPAAISDGIAILWRNLNKSWPLILLSVYVVITSWMVYVFKNHHIITRKIT